VCHLFRSRFLRVEVSPLAVCRLYGRVPGAYKVIGGCSQPVLPTLEDFFFDHTPRRLQMVLMAFGLSLGEPPGLGANGPDLPPAQKLNLRTEVIWRGVGYRLFTSGRALPLVLRISLPSLYHSTSITFFFLFLFFSSALVALCRRCAAQKC